LYDWPHRFLSCPPDRCDGVESSHFFDVCHDVGGVTLIWLNSYIGQSNEQTSENRADYFRQVAKQRTDFHILVFLDLLSSYRFAVLLHLVPFLFQSGIQIFTAGIDIELEFGVPAFRTVVEIRTAYDSREGVFGLFNPDALRMIAPLPIAKLLYHHFVPQSFQQGPFVASVHGWH
jgi:hypothetical protein